MPTRTNTTNDNHSQNGQTESDITYSNQGRTVKSSSMDVRPNKVTTDKRDQLVPLSGEKIHNLDTRVNEYWNGSEWIATGTETVTIGWRGNSLVTQPVGSGATGTITLAENQLFANKVSYSGGELTFNETGTYSIFIELHLDVTSGQNAHIETWIEYDLGAGFIAYPDSGRFLKFGQRTEGVISYKSDLEIIQGVKFRLKARAKSGTIDLISSTLDNGVTSPSVLVSIIKEK